MNKFTKIFLFVTIILSSSALYSQRDLETITSEGELKQYIYANAPSENAFVALERLAAPYIDVKDWFGAINVFKKFQEWFPMRIIKFQQIEELLEAPSHYIS
jgi:hypothetical protein